MPRLRRKFSVLSAAVAAVGLAALSGDARSDVFYEAIALTDQSAPGTSGLVWRGFEAPAVNADGDLAFYGLFGTVGQPAGSSTPGIWGNAPGAMQLVARVGDGAPGTPHQYDGFGGATVGIANNGKLLFRGNITSGNTANDTGFFISDVSGASYNTSLLARESDNAAVTPINTSPFPSGNSTPPQYNNNMGFSVIGPGGTVSFTSALSLDIDNGLTEHSYFISDAASEQTLAIAGRRVTNESADTLYRGEVSAPRVNSSGQAAFAAGLKGADEPTNPTAVFFGTTGDVQVVAAVGRQAPGMPAGNNFHSVHFPDLNDSDQIVFAAGVTNFDDDTSPARGEAIYFGTLGSIAPAAKIGDAVPGPAGFTYQEFATTFGPTVNDSGQIAFVATLGTGDPQDDVLAVVAGTPDSPANLNVVAQEGSLPQDFVMLDGPIIGNSGHIAFTIQDGSDSSLWLTDLMGNLVRIIGTGDTGDVVGLSSSITVTGLKTGTTTDGYRFLTDDGTLAFALLFNDGTEGVFTAAIPEPTGFAALLGAGALLLRRRRR